MLVHRGHQTRRRVRKEISRRRHAAPEAHIQRPAHVTRQAHFDGQSGHVRVTCDRPVIVAEQGIQTVRPSELHTDHLPRMLDAIPHRVRLPTGWH